MLKLQVPGSFKSKSGSVRLSSQSSSFPFREKVNRMNWSAIFVNEYDLPALFLHWGRLDRVTEAITQCKRWRHAPGIADIRVVGLNRASHLGLLAERLYRQVGAFARIQHLGKANQSQHLSS